MPGPGPQNPATAAPRKTVPGAGDISAPIWFSPSGLAGNRWERWAFAGLEAALVAVFLVGLAVPKSVETLPTALLVVVAAAWLFSTGFALLIAVVAGILPLAEVLFREVDPASAAVQVAVVGLLAVGTRFYSTRLSRLLTGTTNPQRSMAASAFGLENLAYLIEGSAQGVAAIDEFGGIRYLNRTASELLSLTGTGAGSADFYARVSAEDREGVRHGFQSRDVNGQLNIVIERGDGQVRTVQATHRRVLVRGEPMIALTLRDVSQVNHLQRAATALAATAAGLAVTQTLEETLAAIAQRVTEVAPAAACAVFLLERERSLRLAASRGMPPGYGAAANLAIEAGADPPVFQAMRTGRPVVVEDLPEVIRTREYMAPMRELVRDVTWRKTIAFPMIHAGRPVGGLSVYLRPDQEPDEPTLDFLSTIASQAASAAEISRLVAQAQDQAAANERLRLSHELHDSLSQRLYGIILGARALDVRLAGQTQDVVEPLEYIVDLAEGGLTEMRELVTQLRPDSVEKEGLVAAVRKHAEAIGRRRQIEIISSLNEEPAVSPDTKVAAYRILVEALNNVARHANAKHVWLGVEVDDGWLRLRVKDDGAGFDAAPTPPGHFGMDTMRERASERGGEVRVRSTPGEGTTVVASLPCDESRLAGQGKAS